MPSPTDAEIHALLELAAKQPSPAAPYESAHGLPQWGVETGAHVYQAVHRIPTDHSGIGKEVPPHVKRRCKLGDGRTLVDMVAECRRDHEADYIAAACNALPALASEVLRLRADHVENRRVLHILEKALAALDAKEDAGE